MIVNIACIISHVYTQVNEILDNWILFRVVKRSLSLSIPACIIIVQIEYNSVFIKKLLRILKAQDRITQLILYHVTFSRRKNFLLIC